MNKDATRVEAIAIGLEAIATRLEAITTRNKKLLTGVSSRKNSEWPSRIPNSAN